MSNVIKTSFISALETIGYSSPFHIDKEKQGSTQLRAQRMARSPQFKQGKVIARMPNVASPESMLSTMGKFILGRRALKPSKRLPYREVDLARLAERSAETRITWLGHSSLYIELDKIRVLIDPVFEYASPWVAKKFFERNVNAPISREKLPTPDVIVISHDHYDHLEESTIRFYADKEVVFYVPLAVGSHLEKWGVKPSQIVELDWWECVIFNGVEFYCTPANHNSGRTGLDSNTTLWCSWAIKGVNGSLFYSGDSAYDEHFKQIGQRLGPFDMAFVEVAANVKEGKGFPVENWGHMQAKHTIQAFQDVQAKHLFPVHWATFELFSHKWDEPMTDLIEEAKQVGTQLVTPMVGETIFVQDQIQTTYWWQQPQTQLSAVTLSYQN